MASAEASPPDDDDAPEPLRESVLLRIGRYELFDRIASGGMATVYLGRVVGDAGFRRTVALKRLHPHLAQEKSFVAMLRDEAHLASRIRHRSVVPVLDVVDTGTELLLVLEFVEGVSLGALMTRLRERGVPMPLDLACGILRGVLAGLGAAHAATDESGAPLDLVHRDVSPQNVLLGKDGIVRIVDFGIAKARGRLQTTDDGRLKGNFAYMAPEQARRKPVTAGADLFAAGVLAWEMLTGRRMHPDDDAAAVLTRVLYESPMRVSEFRDVSEAVDAVVAKALAKEPEARFRTAAEMSEAFGAALGTAGPGAVAAFLREHVGDELTALRRRIERVEGADRLSSEPPVAPTPDAAAVAPRVTEVVDAPALPAPTRQGRRLVALVVSAAVGGLLLAFAVSTLGGRAQEPTGAVPSPAPRLSPSATDDVATAAATSAATATATATTTTTTTTTATATTTASASASVVGGRSEVPSLVDAFGRRPSIRPPRTSVSVNPRLPTPAPSMSTTRPGLEGIPRERE